ncbi:MAG: hypothetical protein CMP65_05660 [Flavobacteriales bacterium]|nr:hypothetical protein [Flavobacteriales bacterium]
MNINHIFSHIICLILISGCKTTNELFIYTNDKQISLNKTPVSIKTINQKKPIHGFIKTRGGSSISYPKKSYEIDLKKDYKIGNLPKDDDYILNSNFIDKTFLRHVLSFKIFTQMNSNNISPKTDYTQLYINDNYQGLYVIMEKMDKSTLKINNNDSLAFIFKEPHIFRNDYAKITPQKKDNFHQQTYPKIQSLNHYSYIEEIRDFIIKSDNDIFNKNIDSIFDIDNIIDWHLLLLITNNSDGILKNFYIYKIDSETPLRIAPWDYDHSFGRDGDNELNMNERKADIKRSILFNRLLEFDWYKKKLKNRWIQHNENDILSIYGLEMHINKLYLSIEKSINKNNQIWPTNHQVYFDTNSSKEEVKIMIKFIKIKHQELTQYFKSI